MPGLSVHLAASGGSFLIKPGIGLMVWTLLVFGLTMLLLWKFAFPPITAALDRRQRAIEEAIDTAERTRREADELLAQYRERLTQARAQADDIVARARKAAEVRERRAIQEIRREVADLTILATEKVTRKVLTEEDQRVLVQEALQELDFAALSNGDRR
jgi:F-type H+-transporting ATPase subunit b